MKTDVQINDLYDYEGLKIWQKVSGFKFSVDSILLAEFIEIKKDDQLIIDFCTGNGVIPLILSQKCGIPIEGYEIQPEIASLANDSVIYNHLENQIKILMQDINDIDKKKYHLADIVCCNPPYFKYNSNNLVNEEISKAISRHELKLNLEQLILQVKKILKSSGRFYLIHRPERLAEIMELLKTTGFNIKRLVFVYPHADADAINVLIEARLNSKPGIKVLKPIYLKNKKSYQNIF